MTDDEFLAYVSSHAATPRALFSKEDIVRLLRLAGFNASAINVELGSRKFYPLPTDQAEPYVRKAREIMTITRTAAEAKASSLRTLARQYQAVAEGALNA